MSPRAVREQLLTGGLICIGILAALLPVYGRKNENNPDKVGHRNVARKTTISPETESALGKQESEQFERSADLVRDPTVEQYVARVAQNVVSHSDWKRSFAVRVLRSPHVNGTSFPGGHIYISSALVHAAQNDDEIAAVIAHQIAHAAARHWAEEMAKAFNQQLITHLITHLMSANSGDSAVMSQLMNTYGEARGADGVVVCVGYVEHGSMGMSLAFLRNQRQNELEADYLGLQYVYKAGYAPSAYVGMLRKTRSR